VRVRWRLVLTVGLCVVVSSCVSGGVPTAPPGEGPVWVDEQVRVADLPTLQVPIAGATQIEVRVAARPSGEPGVCAAELFGSLPNEGRCLALGSAGKLFAPFRPSPTTAQVQMYLFAHPDVVGVRVTIESEVMEPVLVQVEGITTMWIFGFIAQGNGVPSLAFFDSSGATVPSIFTVEYRPRPWPARSG
jgi:hypothetical protein